MKLVADFEDCNQIVKEFEKVLSKPKKNNSSLFYTGVDLGTAYVIVAVLDEKKHPVAGRVQYADVVRDGMIVDYIGAVDIVRNMKKELELDLGTDLVYASTAIPPGTDSLDGGAVKNVVESAGFILTNLVDESTAANAVLQLKNGAVVDVGGGTTGISIFKNGEVVAVVDEPTGGTHFSLVISGAKGISFAEAEKLKTDPKFHSILLPILTATIEKVASIILQNTKGYNIEKIILVGGTACFTGIEKIIQSRTGIETVKPINPMYVTPLGIAMLCKVPL